MANTFVKIQTVTVGSGGAATIDFTSIPQTYTDLKIVASARTNSVTITESCKITFNAITTGYTNRYLFGDGSSASSGTGTDSAVFRIPALNATASVFGNGEVYIPNYTSANYKSLSDDSVAENNAAGAGLILSANLMSNTAAITSIKITPLVGGSFVQYTTATLYGIKSS